MTSSPGEEINPESKHSKPASRDDIPPEYLGSVLRAEIMPADQELPESPSLGSIFRRINVRYVGTLALLLVLIGSGWVCMIGPGRPVLENALTSLKERYAEPTPTNTPRFIPATLDTPKVVPSPTAVRTKTPTRVPPSKTPTEPPTGVPTQEDSCVDAIDINLDDVGKTLCVRGNITGLEEREVGFIVYFSDDRGIFYLVTYDFVWDQAEPGDCIQITGEIQQLGNTPVIVFGWSNIPEFCP